MRKKEIQNKEKHVCAECRFATWVTREEYPHHFDIKDRKPITLKCKHCKFLVLRSQHACPLFQERK